MDASRPASELSPLDLSGEAFVALLSETGRRLAHHLDGLPHARAVDSPDHDGALAFRSDDAPRLGRAIQSVLDEVIHQATARTFNTASGGYFAYVPGGGIPVAALADLIKDVTNRYVGVYAAAPAYAEIEASVVRWFGRWVGLPNASGFLCAGGSMANLAAMQVAHRRARGRASLDALVGYTSDQAHHSVQKAFRLAGFPDEAAGAPALRAISSDARGHIDTEALVRAIDADVAAGLCPAVVVGHAGTTNTGAVDPLGVLADVATSCGAHFHVDAAYGGFFALTERGRTALTGIEQADTVTLDPHKSLFLPYGTGCLLARDVGHLRDAFGASAAYMPAMQADAQRVDFCTLSPELSRPFRGLAVYLAMQLHGKDAFVRALDEKIDLAHHAATRLAAHPEVDVAFPPELSLLAFTLRGRGGGADTSRAHAVRDAVNQKGRVFITGSTLPDGREVLRMCVLHFRTTAHHVNAALDDIEAALAAHPASPIAAPQ